MGDHELVKWLRALLIIWGSAIASLVIVLVGDPTSVRAARGMVGGLLAAVGVTTLTYLLILSWRAAYLSGRNKR